MKIIFLGTGTSQGIPVVACNCKVCKSLDDKDKRLRSSVLIEKDGVIISIDAGPDFRQQLLRENVQHLDAIVITHGHKDHIGGLDDIRSFNYIQKKAMDIYCPIKAIDAIKREYNYVFDHTNYPGIPEMNLIEVNEHEFKVCNMSFRPIIGLHYNMTVFGYRIGEFAYLCDFSSITEAELHKLYGLKVLVVNALRIEPHYSHFNLQQALELINKLKPENAYLTHISHMLGFHEEVQKTLPENVFLGYDGLKLEI